MLIFYCSKQREITKHEVIKVAINVINRDTDKVTLGQKNNISTAINNTGSFKKIGKEVKGVSDKIYFIFLCKHYVPDFVLLQNSFWLLPSIFFLEQKKHFSQLFK